MVSRSQPNYSKRSKALRYLHLSAELVNVGVAGAPHYVAATHQYFPRIGGLRGNTLNLGRNAAKRAKKAKAFQAKAVHGAFGRG